MNVGTCSIGLLLLIFELLLDVDLEDADGVEKRVHGPLLRLSIHGDEWLIDRGIVVRVGRITANTRAVIDGQILKR